MHNSPLWSSSRPPAWQFISHHPSTILPATSVVAGPRSPSPPFNLHSCVRNSRRQVDVSTITWITTWQTNQSLWEWMIGCLTRWSPAQEHHRGLCSHHSSSLVCTPHISSTSQSCHLQKYSDDSAVVKCVRDGQETEDRELLGCFVAWREQSSHLECEQD